MPKDTRKPSSKSLDQSKTHPYPISESKNPMKLIESQQNWEDIRCVICMETPHNPVLLLCTSHGKGCRPYMCDTSPLLSNCLNQFRNKSSSSVGKSCPLCRGRIQGEEHETKAMGFMNLIKRGCSRENCDFSGSYLELIEHARTTHAISVADEVVGSGEMRPVFERGDDVAGPTAMMSGRRRARIRVGWYPRHQLARRDIFA